jgi:uncharacterized protein YebE (UPF0316 family)
MVFPEVFFSAGIIALLRICDVSLGTLRSIFVIQSRKYIAAMIGFFEVLIWIYAMRYIVNHMDNEINLIGYAGGFALGTFLGVSLEQSLGFSHIQINVISRQKAQLIIDGLRAANYGVTTIMGTGINGEITVLFSIIKKNNLKKLKKLVQIIDEDAFISIQPSSPYNGYIPGGRK